MACGRAHLGEPSLAQVLAVDPDDDVALAQRAVCRGERVGQHAQDHVALADVDAQPVLATPHCDRALLLGAQATGRA